MSDSERNHLMAPADPSSPEKPPHKKKPNQNEGGGFMSRTRLDASWLFGHGTNGVQKSRPGGGRGPHAALRPTVVDAEGKRRRFRRIISLGGVGGVNWGGEGSR